MTLIRTRPPTGEPVSVAELKAHLRLGHDGEDAQLADAIKAARETVEREASVALLDQSWRLVLDGGPASGNVSLRLHPVQALTAVTAFDNSGNPVAVDPGSAMLDGYAIPPTLVFKERLCAPNGLEIDFDAGFGQSAADMPDMLKRAVLLLAAHFFEMRAEIRLGDQPASWPAGYSALIAPWKRVRL